jgi:hypothetical protein
MIVELKEAIDVLEQQGSRHQDLSATLPKLYRKQVARFRLGDRTRLLPILRVGSRQRRFFGFYHR